MLKILPTLLTHLCTCILGMPAGKSSTAQEEAAASDARFDVLTGAMQNKIPRRNYLQVHPTFPQLPYVSHSTSNCP